MKLAVVFDRIGGGAAAGSGGSTPPPLTFTTTTTTTRPRTISELNGSAHINGLRRNINNGRFTMVDADDDFDLEEDKNRRQYLYARHRNRQQTKRQQQQQHDQQQQQRGGRLRRRKQKQKADEEPDQTDIVIATSPAGASPSPRQRQRQQRRRRSPQEHDDVSEQQTQVRRRYQPQRPLKLLQQRRRQHQELRRTNGNKNGTNSTPSSQSSPPAPSSSSPSDADDAIILARNSPSTTPIVLGDHGATEPRGADEDHVVDDDCGVLAIDTSKSGSWFIDEEGDDDDGGSDFCFANIAAADSTITADSTPSASIPEDQSSVPFSQQQRGEVFGEDESDDEDKDEEEAQLNAGSISHGTVAHPFIRQEQDVDDDNNNEERNTNSTLDPSPEQLPEQQHLNDYNDQPTIAATTPTRTTTPMTTSAVVSSSSSFVGHDGEDDEGRACLLNYAMEHRIFLRATLNLLTERDRRAPVVGMMDPIIFKAGPLKKATHFVKGIWKNKYVEIRRGMLSYYDDQTTVGGGGTNNNNGESAFAASSVSPTAPTTSPGRQQQHPQQVQQKGLLRKNIPLDATFCRCRAVKLHQKALKFTPLGAMFELTVSSMGVGHNSNVKPTKRLWMANTREERQSWIQAINNAMVNGSVTRANHGASFDEATTAMSSTTSSSAVGRAGGLIGRSPRPPFRDDLRRYRKIESTLRNAKNFDEYMLGIGDLHGMNTPMQIPVRWLAERQQQQQQLANGLSLSNGGSGLISDGAFREESLDVSVDQLFRDLQRDSVSINGQTYRGDGSHGPDRIIAALAQCILRVGAGDSNNKSGHSARLSSSKLLLSRSMDRISESQCLAHARDILLAGNRTRSAGDSYYCVNTLCRNDDLIVVVPSNREADPVNITVEAEDDRNEQQHQLPTDDKSTPTPTPTTTPAQPTSRKGTASSSQRQQRRHHHQLLHDGDFINNDRKGWMTTRLGGKLSAVTASKQQREWRSLYFVLSGGTLTFYEGAQPRPHGFRGQVALRDAVMTVDRIGRNNGREGRRQQRRIQQQEQQRTPRRSRRQLADAVVSAVLSADATEADDAASAPPVLMTAASLEPPPSPPNNLRTTPGRLIGTNAASPKDRFIISLSFKDGTTRDRQFLFDDEGKLLEWIYAFECVPVRTSNDNTNNNSTGSNANSTGGILKLLSPTPQIRSTTAGSVVTSDSNENHVGAMTSLSNKRENQDGVEVEGGQQHLPAGGADVLQSAERSVRRHAKRLGIDDDLVNARLIAIQARRTSTSAVRITIQARTEFNICTMDPQGDEDMDVWATLNSEFVQSARVSGGTRSGRVIRGEEVVRISVVRCRSSPTSTTLLSPARAFKGMSKRGSSSSLVEPRSTMEDTSGGCNGGDMGDDEKGLHQQHSDPETSTMVPSANGGRRFIAVGTGVAIRAATKPARIMFRAATAAATAANNNSLNLRIATSTTTTTDHVFSSVGSTTMNVNMDSNPGDSSLGKVASDAGTYACTTNGNLNCKESEKDRTPAHSNHPLKHEEERDDDDDESHQ